MKRKLLLFLLSICFFLPDFAATGQYNFIRVDGGSGLSNSHVKSIIQDSYGFIWLGTRNGLNRYDGVSMKLYNCYDETLQHGNQVISALFEDNHRQLWVGTDDGVSAIRWRRVNCSAIFPVPVRIKARTFRSLSV